jgi:DNA-binding transcriptional LysR family regulator
MITLQKLRYVIEIVECGSFNEAARRLFISQPSLSGAVRELEQLIGFEIFLRTGKGAVLSPQGADFLGYARQVVEQADLMEMRTSAAALTAAVFRVHPALRLCGQGLCTPGGGMRRRRIRVYVPRYPYP